MARAVPAACSGGNAQVGCTRRTGLLLQQTQVALTVTAPLTPPHTPLPGPVQPRTFRYGDTSVVLKEGSLGDGTGAKVWTCAHVLSRWALARQEGLAAMARWCMQQYQSVAECMLQARAGRVGQLMLKHTMLPAPHPSCHLCRELASHPQIVRDRRVLEIGAGCGACGILGAKLGAAEVVLSDYVDTILLLLRDCVHLNASSGSGGGEECNEVAAGDSTANGTAANGAANGAAAAAAAAADAGEEEEDLSTWDPEDASECGSDADFGALFAEAGGQRQQQQQQGKEQQQAAWDAPPMRICFHDWQDDVDRLSPSERAALAAVPGMPATTAVPPGASIETPSGSGSGAPGLGAEETFDVVVGTDILYEWCAWAG